MSGQPVEQRFANNPNLPIEAADRVLVEDRLKEAFSEGTIDLHQFFLLLEQLWNATVGGDLVPVLRALPSDYRHTGPVLGGDSVGGPPGVAPKGPSIFERRR